MKEKEKERVDIFPKKNKNPKQNPSAQAFVVTSSNTVFIIHQHNL